MDLLLLFLLSSAILVQGYGKSNDPNDEPFLPIYPVYPYSPKLIKRGVEKESTAKLSPELYAPKVDAKDSYSASFGTNHPRDPYYPNYNPYPKVSSSSGYTYYNTLPYSYPAVPYNAFNSYSAPYTVPPPSYATIPYSPSYPGYYYQPPYYYPNYYSQPLFPPAPMPPSAVGHSGDSYSESEAKGKATEKRPNDEKKAKNSEITQYVDGANYISGNQKDLDGQPSTYKSNSLQNRAIQANDLQVQSIPIPLPRTTYRVVSVAGQPVGPDYPLPAPYVKAQQLEELLNRGWVKILTQNFQEPSGYSPSESNKDSATVASDSQAANQNDQRKDTRFVSVPNIIAKTGLTYVVNPSLVGKVNVGQTTGQVLQGPTTQLKNVRYTPLTPGIYSAIEKPEKNQAESNEYDSYENPSSQSSQDYDNSSNQADNEKQQQSYENDSGQSYQNRNHDTAPTSQGFSYQYTGYNPPQTIPQRQTLLYKSNLDNLNFGAKTKTI